MTRSTLPLPSGLALLLTLLPPAGAQEKGPSAPEPSTTVSYRRDVVPILRRHCVSCHTKNEPEGGLSLDTAADFARGGKTGPAFQPGKPDDSLVMLMVTGVKKP